MLKLVLHIVGWRQYRHYSCSIHGRYFGSGAQCRLKILVYDSPAHRPTHPQLYVSATTWFCDGKSNRLSARFSICWYELNRILRLPTSLGDTLYDTSSSRTWYETISAIAPPVIVFSPFPLPYFLTIGVAFNGHSIRPQA